MGRPKGDTQKRIQECALEEFCEIGYNNLSIRKLAKKVGISHEAIYMHFSSKQEIAETLINRYKSIIALRSKYQKNEENPYFRYLFYWILHYQFMNKYKGFANFCFEFRNSHAQAFNAIICRYYKMSSWFLFENLNLTYDEENHAQIIISDVHISLVNFYITGKMSLTEAFTYQMKVTNSLQDMNIPIDNLEKLIPEVGASITDELLSEIASELGMKE
ncbi:MAG: TetR/AcrR family transcriptional regulator [Lachnospiraceae bacterium]|nr:TetR/AcrR family transcriptional regulator [Lachnospiraceae bacterium]